MFLPKKKNKQPLPMPMRIGIVIFILAMAYSGWKSEQRAREGDPDAVSLKRYETLQRFADVDQWRMALNPAYNRDIEFEDIEQGSGEFASCGQEVTLTVNALPQEGQTLDAAVNPDAPVRFTIGSGEAIEAWDRGVRGMRVGGKRRILAGARAVDPAMTEPDAPPVAFDLELTALSPEAEAGAFGAETLHPGTKALGVGVSCGEPVAVALRVFDAKGEIILEHPPEKPLRLTLGQGEYGHGMDRGLVGMFPGEQRRLRIPPAFQSDALPFPKGEIAVVEVWRVPYNRQAPSLPDVPLLTETGELP